MSYCACFTFLQVQIVVEVLVEFVADLLGGTCSAMYNYYSVTNILAGSWEIYLI